MSGVSIDVPVSKVLWKLRTVMADRKISNKILAEELSMNPVSISKLKNNDELPEIGGPTLAKICDAITKLSSKPCTPYDLIAYETD
ncbi:MAG: helix-turn-helix domain-containing protein [Prochloraceae cyanobacterium]